MALVVLTLLGVAGFQALSTSTRSSVAHRRDAVGDTVIRSTAESLQSPDVAYIARAGCSGTTGYTLAAVPSSAAGYRISIVTTRFWTGASATPVATATVGFTSTCPATAAADPGLQAVELRLVAPDGRVLTQTVLKRRP